MNGCRFSYPLKLQGLGKLIFYKQMCGCLNSLYVAMDTANLGGPHRFTHVSTFGCSRASLLRMLNNGSGRQGAELVKGRALPSSPLLLSAPSVIFFDTCGHLLPCLATKWATVQLGDLWASLRASFGHRFGHRFGAHLL